ncbi:tyrosine-type recombinase/integrase [Dyadobacter frigoris]|uniref:Recombinase XerD n=1 Tax=Dyadobacter frigoris TaxID=2576211 RepID=A0A4U6CPX4_9BACT|nr:tyrosine-type recombinase/integrase [Dyadobacter frigoris]TKT85471.1 recombinase XerD [Dyadobacter frigoris]GLU56252.1 hypothetical protein Dfri01_57130 [Dyadobacter frigoris]
MSRPIFNSVFANHISLFLDFRENGGVKYMYPDFFHLKKLDVFFLQEGLTEISFSRDQAIKWKQRSEDESVATQYDRINITKRFFEYLFIQGFPVVQIKDIKHPKSNFTPHIYTDEEIDKYFRALDSYESGKDRKHKIQLPVLFRIMLCCGTRITETIKILRKDVDLDSGIIRLSETKNSKQRYVVMSDSLLTLMRSFADKTFYALVDNDYIFTSVRQKYISASSVSEIHHKILQYAGIPNKGSGRYGKRVHDWRHTFAVKAFKQMIDSGEDMYVALPILSVYLGHYNIYSTERYLRLTTSMYPYLKEKFEKNLDEIFEK